MQVKFKNEVETFTGSNVVEQKLYRAGEVAGWVLSMTLEGELNSTELDAMLTAENISEITLTSENVATPETTILTGYNKVTSCVVKYADAKSVAEIQLTKGV